MIASTPLDRYRNIGILAKPDAGRTTTTERLLSCACGDAGEVQLSLPGLEEEDERQITLTAASVGCEWHDTRINIVELAAVDAGARSHLVSVLDSLVVVVDGTPDLAEAELVLSSANSVHLIFVNKLDRATHPEGVEAEFPAILDRLGKQSAPHPVAIQLPYGRGLTGLVDLVAMEAMEWRRSDLDAPGVITSVPAHLRDRAIAARIQIAAAVGVDPSISADEMRVALRAAVLDGRIIPVLCGSAFHRRGIEALLNAVVDYLPAPNELVSLRGNAADGRLVERLPSDQDPFSAVAFAKTNDPAQGDLTFVRVFSGVVATGSAMLNTVSASPERIGRMVRMHANRAEEVEEARAGDIVAFAGLQHTATGDTLCDPAAPLIVEQFPLMRVPAAAGRAKH